MANGQILGGGFDPRFRQAPIVEGQPVGTVPGESAPTVGGGGLTPPTKPPAPLLADDDPRKMAQDLKDIQGNLGLEIKRIVSEAERNPTLATNIRQATISLLREYDKTRDLRKDAEKLAGISTLRADADSDKIHAFVAKVKVSLVPVPEATSIVAVRGEPGEIPTAETIAQGPPRTFAPVKPTKSFRLLTSAEKKRAGLPESSTAQIDSQGRITVPRDPTPKQIEQGKPGAFSDIAQKFDKQRVAVRNLSRRGREIIGLVEQGGADVIGTSGFMSRIVSAFGVQSKSIAKKFGVSFNTESYDFPESSQDAAEARIIKSAILDMAILKAQTLGLGTGKALSDKDIQNQINTISDSLGDPIAFSANLKQAVRNAALDFQQEARILFRKPDFDIQGDLLEADAENAMFFDSAPTQEATPQDIPEITLTDEQKTSMKIPLDRDIVIQQGENRFLVKPNAR